MRRRALHLVQTEDFASSLKWFAKVKSREKYHRGLLSLCPHERDGTAELKDKINWLRRELIWLNLLRTRRYDRPQSQYLYDRKFY